MNKTEKKAIIIILIVCVILLAATMLGKLLGKFRYEAHLDEAVVTVDDTEISLREFGYYIYEVEAFVQEQALLYDAENPKLWWNTYFMTEPDSQFIAHYANQVAIETCVMEEIYYQEALREGIVLTDVEEAEAIAEAQKTMGAITQEQLDATGLNQAIIVTMKKKEKTSVKYARYLVENQRIVGYSGNPEELVNWDGAYYREEVKPLHQVETKDKLLDQIQLGTITVNREL